MKTQEGSHAKLPRTGIAALLTGLDVPGEIQLPDGTVVAVGTGAAQYKVIFRSQKALRTPMTELGVGKAYIAGDIEIQGDLNALFGARKHLQGKVPIRQKLQFLHDYFRTATSMNSEAVVDHYARGDELYLAFIDKRFRLYSHGIFKSPDESIEQASENKMETMFQALDLKPGMRLLDLGGGWGGVTQHCGPRGVHVTTITLTEGSVNFIKKIISENNLPGEVFLQDVLTYTPREPFDHIVTYGVIEHLPDYRRVTAHLWDLIKPGGRIYLDGSAAITKFAVSPFTRDYIWGGTHTFMTVQDVVAEFLYHGFDVIEVVGETKDYELTMLEWAKRLDRAKDDVIARWGEEVYRIFRLFLWGGTHAFKTNSLQAYHVVVEKRADMGPRPSTYRRLVQFLGNLR